MSLLIEPVEGIGEVAPGDDLASMLAEALRPMAPADTDVLVVTHQVVSKAEGAVVGGGRAGRTGRWVEERRSGPL